MTGPFSSPDAFEARRLGLEEEYFRSRDSALVSKLKKVFTTDVNREELRQHTGIVNDELLDRLVAAHVNGHMLAAFRVYPLVEIAWADGSVDPKEQAAVLSAAAASGLPTDGPAHERLLEWMRSGPNEDLRNVWKSYARELVTTLSPEELATFRKDLLTYARLVAEASGGILGVIYRTSPGEQRVIDEIGKLLTKE